MTCTKAKNRASQRPRLAFLAFLVLACAARRAHAADAVTPTHCGHPCPARGSRGPTKNVHGWRKWKDLVHYHIAKNAGTTLRSVITKRYGGLELHGPGKKAYGEYFNDAGRKWAGRYFVAMARDPTAKLLSQFFYARSTLGGAYGDWHRCVTFGEYVESRRARHNHQYGQMVTGNRKGACGNDAEKPLARPQHRATVKMLCAGGEAVLRERILEILREPRLFLGVVEEFDASLLALQAETGLPDVTYCHRRSTKGASTKPDALDEATRADVRARNVFDELFYAAAREVFEWKKCCYGVDAAAVAAFRATNAAYQARACPPEDKMQKPVDPATVGNPAWHRPANASRCASLDRERYALPRRDGTADRGAWKPKGDANPAFERWRKRREEALAQGLTPT